ncbi:MAG TPA: GNAT family N-acetyltransferase [Streptosporangiaceae bacterium]|nr:GNAT family N-acetyltransferase [Streptosporangiaceae bacterium]
MDIRPLGPQDDPEIEVALARRAFGPVDAAEREDRLADARAVFGTGRALGAFDGPQAVAVAMFHDMRQWWHGRPLRMAGVGGVKVAPEERGRGIGRALMTELLRVIAERGYALSVLFPATTPLYRSLGWELAGDVHEAVIPTRSLAALPPPDGPRPALRRAGPQDAAEAIAVLDAVYESSRCHGPGSFDAETFAHWSLGDDNDFCYLAPDGFLAYRWHGSYREREIKVDCLLAASQETTRALWSVVASHAAQARLVRAIVPAADPVAWLTREADVGLAVREPWMLRVVDAAAAVAGRGFPAAVEAAVSLRIEDGPVPANDGPWRLEVGGGHGSLNPDSSVTRHPASPGAPGPVTLGARGFAALYAGVPMATLRRAGLAAGGDARADDALDAAFAGPAFMLQDF